MDLELSELGSVLDLLDGLGDPEGKERPGRLGQSERGGRTRGNGIGLDVHSINDDFRRKDLRDGSTHRPHEPRSSLHGLLGVGLELLFVREHTTRRELLDLVRSV